MRVFQELRQNSRAHVNCLNIGSKCQMQELERRNKDFPGWRSVVRHLICFVVAYNPRRQEETEQKTSNASLPSKSFRRVGTERM